MVYFVFSVRPQNSTRGFRRGFRTTKQWGETVSREGRATIGADAQLLPATADVGEGGKGGRMGEGRQAKRTHSSYPQRGPRGPGARRAVVPL